MSPTILEIIQALIQLGPEAAEAIIAVINAIHGQQPSDQQQQAIGRAMVQVIQQKAAQHGATPATTIL